MENNELLLYLKAGFPGLCMVSPEELRVLGIVAEAAAKIKRKLFVWRATSGFSEAHTSETGDITLSAVAPAPFVVCPKCGHDAKAEVKQCPQCMFQFNPTDPLDALTLFELQLPSNSVLLAQDYHLFLSQTDPHPVLIRKVKDALMTAKSQYKHLILGGCQSRLCPELEKEFTVLEIKLPDREQLAVVLRACTESNGIPLNGNTDAILDAARGLTTAEAENIFYKVAVATKKKDIPPEMVGDEKALAVKKSGIVEFLKSPVRLEDIGGLDNLKRWLVKRRLSFGREARLYGLPVVKGCLTVGIPGSGKSLTAKAAANILGVPLLKLDAGRVFAGLVGQSEANMRSAIATADAVAPCVVWVDEIEKGFSGSRSSNQSDGGTSARVLGTFLSWMKDKTEPVFVFATANDISQLPPEFLRKGRFDEIWFVDLPDFEERKAIWTIHIAKRGRKPEAFDVDALAEVSQGFTGAEIEAALTEAMFSAFDDGKREPTAADCVVALQETVPLSKTMATEIASLRSWAENRARVASSPTKRRQAPVVAVQTHGRPVSGN